MRVLGVYDFNNAKETFDCNKDYKSVLKELVHAINSIDESKLKTKKSNEKNKKNKLLYSPVELNNEFKKLLTDWKSYKEKCQYKTEYYIDGYKGSEEKGFREMDFVKNKVGVEIQFGKYSFMVYNVCAKMTIFKNKKIINVGIEVVPIKEFAKEMSSGVSYFEEEGIVKKFFFTDDKLDISSSSAEDKAQMWINLLKINRINEELPKKKNPNKNVKKMLEYSDKLYKIKTNYCYTAEFYERNKFNNSTWNVKSDLYSCDKKYTDQINYLEAKICKQPLKYEIIEISRESIIKENIQEGYPSTVFMNKRYNGKTCF